MQLALLKSMNSGSEKKAIRNHVSTEKLMKQDEFKGAMSKQMLAERLWYDTHVRTYLSHASPDGGMALFQEIQKLAYPIAIALSHATTSTERAAAILILDEIKRHSGLDKEITNRFPAVFERAMNRDTVRYHTEYLSVTLGSDQREPLAVMVSWRVASMLANGPKSPSDWIYLTRYVEEPRRVLRDADTITILACWREWLSLTLETMKLGLTTPGRIAPGMKDCLVEFMSYMSEETKYKLRVKGLFAEGLDHRLTTWDQLKTVYDEMYAKCGFLTDEPNLQRYLRKSERSAHVGKQVSVNPHPRPNDTRQGRSPTPPSRRVSSSGSRSHSRSRSRSASVASNVSLQPNRAGDKTKEDSAKANAAADAKKRKSSADRKASAAKVKTEATKAAAATGAAKPGARSRSNTPRGRPKGPRAHAAKDEPPHGTCFEFWRTGVCGNKAKCSYRHERPPTGAAAKQSTPRGSSQDRAKSPGAQPGGGHARECFNCGKTGHMFKECKKPRPSGQQVCFFYKMNGSCNNGKDCRYLHTDKANPAKVEKPPEKTGEAKDKAKDSDFP